MKSTVVVSVRRSSFVVEAPKDLLLMDTTSLITLQSSDYVTQVNVSPNITVYIYIHVVYNKVLARIRAVSCVFAFTHNVEVGASSSLLIRSNSDYESRDNKTNEFSRAHLLCIVSITHTLCVICDFMTQILCE